MNWFAQVDPNRPDPHGAEAALAAREAARIRNSSLEDIRKDLADAVRALSMTLRTAGGPGSGNFGHAGRPGEVGGSSSEGGAAQADHLLPKGLKKALGQVDVQITRTQDQATEKIDAYLLKHYGFDSATQARSMVDTDRRVIIARDDQKEVLTQWAHLATEASPELKAYASQDPQQYSDMFADFLMSEPMQKIMGLSNPVVHAIADAVHHWRSQ